MKACQFPGCARSIASFEVCCAEHTGLILSRIAARLAPDPPPKLRGSGLAWAIKLELEWIRREQ